MSDTPAVETDSRAPCACKRCGHLESVHDDIDGCQVVTGCTPGSMQMEACDCEGFVPEDVL